MLWPVIAIISLVAASQSPSEVIRVGAFQFHLPESYRHVPSKQASKTHGVIQHTKEDFRIAYDVGDQVGTNRLEEIRKRWPKNIVRDEAIKTSLGEGHLIVLSGDGTDKTAYFEITSKLALNANLGVGTFMDDFIMVVRSVEPAPLAPQSKMNAEQDVGGQPATPPRVGD